MILFGFLITCMSTFNIDHLQQTIAPLVSLYAHTSIIYSFALLQFLIRTGQIIIAGSIIGGIIIIGILYIAAGIIIAAAIQHKNQNLHGPRQPLINGQAAGYGVQQGLPAAQQEQDAPAGQGQHPYATI